MGTVSFLPVFFVLLPKLFLLCCCYFKSQKFENIGIKHLKNRKIRSHNCVFQDNSQNLLLAVLFETLGLLISYY